MTAFNSVSWHGPHGDATVHLYPDRTPILSVRAAPCNTLYISPADGQAITTDELRFARELADAAAAYAQECERWATPAEAETQADRGAA